MRQRRSARIILLDPQDRILLFRFRYATGALEGVDYWSLPGGGLEAGESFEEAGIRELREETGFVVTALPAPIATREFPLRLVTGETVAAHERFFVLRTVETVISRDLWTPDEQRFMVADRWWSVDEIETTEDTVYPPDLAAIIRQAAL